MPYFNIDKAVKYVKIIADSNRCPTCDKLFGDRLRYSCGHIICGECVEDADECLVCVNSSKSSKPQIDKLKGQQVQNASCLLTSFQDAFKVDVYKRYRLSEKLEIEKQVFPELIPVSVTYFNKRKSQSLTKENNENVPCYLDGETMSNLDSITMNTRVKLVQNWLDDNEKCEISERKPFSDINLNRPLRTRRDTNILNIKSKKLPSRKKNATKKSKNFDLKISNAKSVKQEKSSKQDLNRSLIRSYVKPYVKDENKVENTRLHIETYSCKKEGKSGNGDNESNTIVIEDSLSPVVDKDKQAWLAVLERNNSENQINNSTITTGVDFMSFNKPSKNVCFYKKDCLFKSCYFCLNNCNNYSLENQRLTCNDISITIKTDSIATSMSIIQNNEIYNDKMLSKHSIEVQTEEIFFNEDKNICSPFISILQNNLYSSENINTEKDRVVNDSKDSYKSGNLQGIIINDSDSDTDINCSGPIIVTADVHRSSDIDYGVLSSVDSNNYKSRLRQSRLRRTIDSNNSSEKENVEPNKAKKLKLNKKNELKK